LTNRASTLAAIPEEIKENPTAEDLEMLELEDILDDPDDTEYPVHMTDPSQLMEIF